ncbi:mannosyltransferase [Chitinophaga ginsengisegetis]|uniref:mannosyltransferase n=1 Tax=Chitinophaga ginsengisegetis TaxID=393003 RepID=UPI000DB9FA1E|nr:mannosyltransferase [Chitinophaga ginsengisegetis]MDR6570732.1 phosphatidylinositol glycan class B [Chitinophaga ginsengisegetis]MDR6650466.1 phosphatidylinositol glycan class B [Chitinophaga ginsengisegetis]MDR6656895.1 phosphatidylinositol glycan class B [Chitinophaga ginsengisegetis]
MKVLFQALQRAESSKLFLPGVIVFYLFVAWGNVGFHNPDEHFQIIEFAQYKSGIATLNDLAWEYNAKVRSGLQPAICFLIFRACRKVGITDPYMLAFILRAITAILSVLIIKKFVETVKPEITERYRIVYAVMSFFLWFLPYINVRFSSESWSGLFFLLSLSIILSQKQGTRRNDLLLGVLWGLTILFRYQSALLIAGTVLWLLFIRKTKAAALIIIFFSGLAVLMMGTLVDKWLYGSYAFVPYNYFRVNIMEDIASYYGVSPWYEIIFYIIRDPGPIGIFIFLSILILLVYQPRHIILWACLPFLIAHAIIPHKELRFVFPVANLVPFLLILAYQQMIIHGDFKRFKPLLQLIFVILLISNMAGLIVVATKAAGNTKASLTAYIHYHYSNKAVNLLYLSRVNPYQDWAFPQNTFYRKVLLTEIITVWQEGITEKKRQGYTNLLVIPENEITGPRTIARLKELHLVKVHQTIPPIDQRIIGWYKPSLNEDNLILYEIGK